MNKQLLITIFTIMLVASFVSAIDVVSISASSDEITPGASSTISVKVENNDNFDLTDVGVSLDLTNLPFTSSDSLKTFDLDSDKSKTSNLEISALKSAKSGVYTIPVKISYIRNMTPVQKLASAVLTVNSKPVLEAQAEDGLILKGQNNDLKIKIINKGLADVKFLEIQVSSGSYTLLSPSKAYIGNIDSNDFDSATFKVFISANSGSTISVPVTIMYKDITNKAYTENQIVTFKVYSQKEAYSLGLLKKSNVGTIVIIIILAIIAFFVYRAIRKYMKKRKLERAKAE